MQANKRTSGLGRSLTLTPTPQRSSEEVPKQRGVKTRRAPKISIHKRRHPLLKPSKRDSKPLTSEKLVSKVPRPN